MNVGKKRKIGRLADVEYTLAEWKSFLREN